MAGDTTTHPSGDGQPKTPVKGEAVTPPPSLEHRPGDAKPGIPRSGGPAQPKAAAPQNDTKDDKGTKNRGAKSAVPSAQDLQARNDAATGAGSPAPSAEGTEVTGARTDSTSVYQNPDGTRTLRVYPRPVHYRKADGSWGDINTNFSLDRSGRWAEQANSQQATFAVKSDDPSVVSWSLDSGHTVSYGLQGAASVRGVVQGDTLTYPLARPASDVVYNGLAQGIKESLVLHDATAPTSWLFPLHATGLTPAIGPAGEVQFKDASGAVRLTIPRGFMMDAKVDPASGDGVVSDGVHYRLIDQNGVPALQMDLDETWLHDPKRVFPITVDPSTTSIGVGQSTFVRSDQTANFSTDPLLRIGTSDGGASKVNSYLYFPGVAGALQNDYLHAVSLNLNNTHSYECSPHPVYVNQITSGWDPATINTYPGVSIGQQMGTASFSAGETCGGAMWEPIDLGRSHNDPGVQLVESWARGGANYGLALTASTTDSNHWKKFSSANSAYPPYLSIVYSDWAATYAPAGSYMPPTYNTPGYQQVTLTNMAANWWNSQSMQVKARLFDSNWNEQWFNAPLTGVSGLVKTYDSVTVNGVIPPLPLGRSYYLCWDGYVGGTTSLHDSYSIPFGTCNTVSGANTAPQLDVLAPPNNTVVGNLTPQLYATGHDPDNYPGTGLDYDFRVYTNPSSGDPQLIAESGWQSSTSWAVPTGKLAWNTGYLWNVKVGDHIGESPLSSTVSFSTQVQQPVITSHLGGAVGDGAGRPFDAKVGNYTTAATDADVKSIGPALTVNRSYNSLDPRASTLFGNGWTSNFDMRVQPDNDGTDSVVLTTASGRAARFGADPNKGALYTPPSGEFQSLTKVAAGFDLMAKDGTRYEFHVVSGDGYALSLVRDAVGRTQELSYTNGVLTTVKDTSSSRVLHFEWTTGNRHVAKVYTDPATGADWNTAQAWTYTYNTSNLDQLDQVCAPATGGNTARSCTTYTYGTGSHLRSAVLDSAPASYWRLGEKSGSTAASEVAENQGNDNARYSSTGVTLGTPGPTAFGPTASGATAATFDGSSGFVGLPSSVLDTSSYTSVGLWFKTTSWGVLFSYQADAFPGNGTTPVNYTPALFVGRSGKLHGKFWNGPSNTIDSKNPVNDDKWHFALLSAAGNTQTLYLDGDAQGTLPGAVIAPGQRSEAVGGGFLSSGWPDNPYGQPGQANYFNGSISDVAFYNRALGAPAVKSLWQAGSQQSVELSGIKLPSGKSRLAVTYDTVNDRAAKVTDENGGTWSLEQPTVTGSSQEYRGSVMGSRPNGYWRLSDGAGAQASNQVYTPRPTPNNGTYANVDLGSPGPMTGSTGSASFDGTTSWAELPAAYAPQNGPGALALWFRTDRAGVLLSYQSFPVNGTPNGTTDRWNPALYVDSNGKLRAQLWMGDAAPTLASGATVTDNKWHFAVISADTQSSQTLYLDGTQAAGPLNGTIIPNGTGHVFLGAGNVTGGWPQAPADRAGHFKGQLADAAAYPHGLSATAVSALYRLATTADATQYDAAVVDGKPTGYWRLGDTAGNQAAELISSAALAQNRGTNHNTTCCQTGPWASGTSTATGFNGTNAYVQLPPNTAPKHWGAATVELWFKTTAPGVLYSYQSFPIDGKPNGSTDRWNPALYIGSDKKLYGALWTGSANNALVSSSTVTDGAWHHVALAGDSNGQTLYLDGAPTATSTTALPITYNGSAYAYLGAGWTGGGWPNPPSDQVGYFNGAIADFSIFRYPLSKDTVSAHYNRATSAAVVGGLDAASAYRAEEIQDSAVGYWRLNDPSGSWYAASQLGSARPDVNSGNLTDVLLNGNGPSSDPNQRSAVFNGTTSQIQLPADAAPVRGPASIELWFKTTSGGPLYSYQDFPVGGPLGNSWNPALYVGSDGRIHGEFWMGPNTVMTSDRTVNDGKWHQVVLAADDSGQTIYIDGQASASDTSGRKITFNGTPYVYLGAGTTSPGWPGGGSDHFAGNIAEASYYTSRIDAATVAAHYKAMGNGGTATPVTTAIVTDPTGYKLTYQYDTRSSRLLSRSDGYGNTTRYSYDTAGYLYAVSDANGHTITTGHDARGNTVSRTTCRGAGSCQTSYATYYLDAGNPFNLANDKILTSSDARSSGPSDTTYTTRYTYDAYGQLASTTLPATPDFPKGRVSYTLRTNASTPAVNGGTAPIGLVRSQTGLLDPVAYPDPNNIPADQQTTYLYQNNGDVASVISPLRPKASYGYDNLGRTISQSFNCDDCPGGTITAPRTLETDYTWDGQGNQVTRTEPYTTDAVTGAKHTRQTTSAYDIDGNQVSRTVADTTGGDQARTTTWTYEPDTSRVKQVKDAGGHLTSFTYDRYGNTATRTDAAGTTYSYSYSPMGQLQQTAITNYTGSSATPTAPRWQVIGSRAYDPAGRLATDTDGMGRTTHTYYNDDNTVAEIDLDGYHNTDGTLRNVVLQQNTYDDAGHLAQQVTGGGKTTTATAYDAAGRVIRTTVDPGGLNRTTVYTYDVANRPTTVVSTGGADTSSTETDYAYDVTGNVLKQTARNQPADSVVVNGYNSRGLRISTISPNGNAVGADPAAYTSSVAYDEAGRPTVTTGPLVSAESFDPTSRGSKSQQVRPIGRMGYDTFGQSTSQVDALGNTVTYTYDLDGNRVAVAGAAYTDPQSGTTITPTSTAEYDALGRPVTTVIDPTGLKLTRTMRYDQAGNVVQTTLPPSGGTSTPTVTNSYDLDGELLATTGPTGAVSQSTYDDLGRRITSTQLERYPAAAAYTTTFTWDDAGNQLSSTTPGGGTSKATYNAAGQVLSAIDPAGLTVRQAYDGLGRAGRVTKADGTTTVTGYDRLGRTVSTTDLDTIGAAVATQYATYDLEGNVLSATDKVATSADIAAHARQFSYNPAGQIVQQVEPVAAGQTITTSYGYDTGGRKTRWTNGKNIPVYYTYNSLGLPESTVEPPTSAHPTAAESLFTTSYDAAGRAVTLTEPGGVVRRRSYDGAGNLTQETATGAEVATPNRTLGYDAAGRLTSAGTLGATPDTYSYNDRGQLLTSAGPGGASNYSYNGDSRMTARTDAAGTTSFGYNAAGQVTSATDPLTGTTVGYDYDTAGRLATERYGTGGTRSYGYDNLGRLRDDTIKNPSGAAVASIGYGYDLNNRITSKTTTGTAGAATNQYGYDLAGRLTSWNNGATASAYAWDAAGNRTSAGGATSTFDERNELLNDGTTTYSYSARGTLTGSTAQGYQPKDVQFDGFNRMVKEGPSTYTYDSTDRVTQTGNTTFTYDGGSNNIVTDGTASYTRSPGGRLLGTATTGAMPNPRLVISDQHTDVVATIDPAAKSVAGSTAYDPFGKPTASAGAGNSLGYQSGWTDPASGDVNMAARWYRPGSGTFASRDSWQLGTNPSVQGNRFTYGNGDPIDSTDPSGHYTCYPVSNFPFRGFSITCEQYIEGPGFDPRDFEGNDWSGGSDDPPVKPQINCDKYWWTTDCGGLGYQPPQSTGPISTSELGSIIRGGGSGDGGRGHPGPHRRRPGPRTPPGPTLPRPKPPVDFRPINDHDRPHADPNPFDFFTDTIVAVGAAAVTTVVAEGATIVVGTVTTVGPGLVAGTDALIDLGKDLLAKPEPAPEPKPRGRPAPGTDEDRDCRNGFGTGWRSYSPVDVARGSRATSVEACLDENFIKPNGSGTKTRGDDTITPPGYWWAKDYVRDLGNGNKVGSWRNACHLLASSLGGDGDRYENIATCSRTANSYAVDKRGPEHRIENMDHWEKKVKEAVEQGEVVHYTVTPRYDGDRVVPIGFEMKANGYKPGGVPGISFNKYVPNEMFSLSDQQWHNMGQYAPTEFKY
ncbi:LamG-like jellyroll fold domain-containing protein [Streptomyces rubellomurinus]|uniref:LamG-like jellyroll fold domain-containing protein n=1 Tax=Streptomyces rubellomurinus (strain ATCC 31215) TaxID=359131 RepID=UPI0006968545|nr:LamG-like jellyroll fold domain-containing protein [Streptomyces rubellomurinus]